MMKNKAVAYVDGSYNKKEDLCGWGVVFLYEDEAPEYFSGSCRGIHWNVTGEINAAVYAEVKEPAKKGKKTKDLPGIGEGINPRCEKAIRLFRKKRNPRFKDFMELKSYGQDKYSRLKEEGLVLTLGEDVCEEIRGKVNEPEGYLPALRWAARGLSAEDASRKANVDLEVSANCR